MSFLKPLKKEKKEINRQEVLGNIDLLLNEKLTDIQLKKFELLLKEHPIKLQIVLSELDKQINY